MPTNRIQIRSSSNPDDPRPWFEYAVDIAGKKVTFTKANGRPAMASIVKDHAIAFKPGKLNERHVLAVTEDGVVEFVPVSEQRPVYYAHLAWYDPTTQTLEILEFTEVVASL